MFLLTYSSKHRCSEIESSCEFPLYSRLMRHPFDNDCRPDAVVLRANIVLLYKQSFHVVQSVALHLFVFGLEGVKYGCPNQQVREGAHY